MNSYIDNLDIFINSHRSFEPIVSNPTYKILFQKEKLVSNSKLDKIYVTPENIGYRYNMGRAYSDTLNMYWAWKNLKLKQYIGFCQYGAYLDFLDNLPDLNKEFLECDIICLCTQCYPNVQIQYELSHSDKNWEILKNIIKTHFTELYEDFIQYSLQSNMYHGDMFVMSSNHFDSMMKQTFDIMDQFDKILNIFSDKDSLKYVNLHKNEYLLNKSGLCNKELYQARIQAYLVERLFSFYIWKNLKRRKIITYIDLETNPCN